MSVSFSSENSGILSLNTYLLSRRGFTDGTFESSSFSLAVDLAGVDAPKSPFMFTMVVGIRTTSLGDGIEQIGAFEADRGSESLTEIQYSLKSATRPAPTFEFQDVNYYNYRTKVQTKIDYGTFTVVMYDDQSDKANDLFVNYLKSVSPIANLPGSFSDNLGKDELDDFSLSSGGASSNFSTTGDLFSERGHLAYIKIYHYYYKNVSGRLEPETIVYEYLNPKVTTVQYSDLSMSDSEASTISLTFNFDSVHIRKGSDPDIFVPATLGEASVGQLTDDSGNPISGGTASSNSIPEPDPEKDTDVITPRPSRPTSTTPGSGEERMIRALNRAGIKDQCLRRQIMAQTAHESQGFTRVEENLNYSSVDRLATVFPRHFRNNPTANRFVNNPEALANRVYGGRSDLGNGPESSGDGYRYRGRGYIQLTGRSNYAAASRDFGVDFENNPDLAADDQYVADLAVWFTTRRSPLKSPCDVKASTRQINGGQNGLEDRENRYRQYGNNPAVMNYDPNFT